MIVSRVEIARRSQEGVVIRYLLLATKSVAATLIKYLHACNNEYSTVQVGQLSISDVLATEFKFHSIDPVTEESHVRLLQRILISV